MDIRWGNRIFKSHNLLCYIIYNIPTKSDPRTIQVLKPSIDKRTSNTLETENQFQPTKKCIMFVIFCCWSCSCLLLSYLLQSYRPNDYYTHRSLLVKRILRVYYMVDFLWTILLHLRLNFSCFLFAVCVPFRCRFLFCAY